MDDDGMPQNDCLEKLLVYRNRFHFICPLVMPGKKDKDLSFGLFDYESRMHIRNVKDIENLGGKKFLIGSANPFNGTLISKRLVHNIGFPKKEMFIWGDETEYMLRARKNKFEIVTVLNVRFYHPKQKKEVYSSIIKLGDIFYTKDPKRLYIYIRNYIYLESRFKKRACVQTVLRYLIFFAVQKRDIKELFICFRAILNGFFGRFD
jgi:rhamnopyranosyl-N-acetylglucosaminyl-diphospho-decaprenol beta-1,3/1,4-galactofuranosyltransferase